MKQRLLIIVVTAFSFTLLFAQNEEKYSPSTLQFLSERNGEIQLPKTNQKVARTMVLPTFSPVSIANDPMLKNEKYGKRRIAEAEPMNGTSVISAFVVVMNHDFSGLEGLGVTFQSKFDDRAAVWIPVDKIEDVAALPNVTKISVAEVLDVVNDRQRIATQAGDAISNSAAAQALGLTKQYTGKNVILGIIDTGIDFQHIAFKDKNGNNRIVRAYKLQSSNSTSLTTYSSTSEINNLTYDTNEEDHGTHTSTTAGGSSVIVSGNTVTVTDDHANATYGGMAPEANLVIAGLSSLYNTSIATAIQNICNYADQQGKPCVISLSLGSQQGPHDGTGDIASVINQYAGNNHIIVYASSNDAMRSNYFESVGTSTGGGMYASGISTSTKPMMANLQRSWADATGNVQLYASTIHAYARSTNVTTALKFHVVDTSTGNVVYSSSAYTNSTTISMTGSSGLAQYFKSQSGYYNEYGDNATIRLVRGTTNNKYYWTVYTPLLVSTSNSQNSSSIYSSKYALCVSVYPTTNGASTTIDMWEGYGVNWFGNDLTLSSSAANSYNLVQGNDECSVSDDACNPNVISVGAYVTKNSITDYAGTAHDYSSEYPNIGDHASFSSWQTAGYGPLGTALPHISAPGARIVAGVNHYHTASVDDYSYWSDDYIGDLVVNNSNYPYAAMEGTSMATPCVSGIVAQWLQACVEAGKTPTPDYIKEVMAATWDTDEWTAGTASGAHGAKTFGTHGKINAIKGLQYILGVSGVPTIKATPTAVTFDENSYATRTYTKTVTVKGTGLEGNITAAISGNAAFSIDRTTITQTDGSAQADITITWSPTVAGAQTATITLTSTNAETVTVSVTGTAKAADPFIMAEPETLTFSTGLNESQSLTFDVLSEFLTGDITVTLNDANGVFSVSPTSITKAASEEGATVTVTFESSEEGTFTGTVVLSSVGAESVTINLSAEAADGGSASDAYLNIAKYATIDEAGWNTTYVNTLYKYTEYENEGVAWLTLPVYGAWSAVNYNSHPQKWIESSTGTSTSTSGWGGSSTYNGVTWNASSPLLGSSSYFTGTSGNGRARAMGVNSGSNTTQVSVTFYVTNTTAIKLYGLGRNGVSSDYPARLQVYECTKNAGGTITAGTSTVKDLTNTSTSTSSPYTLTADGLTATKIYKVVVSNYRGYMYEVAFKTPLAADPELAVNPTSLSMTANVNKTATQTVTVTGTNLTAGISTAISGANAGMFSVSPSSLTTAGGSLTVTYAPTATGNHTATLTLSSTGATPVTVTLNGTATEPELIVDEDALTFSTYAGNTDTDTFGVLGENLNGAVTLTLNDANNVFSLNSTSATKAEAEAGKTFTVTFAPSTEGTYNATVTVSTEGLADQTVTLTGTATKSYVDVTVSRYGLTTLYTDIPLAIPDNDDLLGVYYAYNFDIEGKEIRIKRFKNNIPALTGMIIQGNSGTYRFPIATTSVTEVDGNLLQGTLVDMPTSDVNGVVLTLQMGSNGYIGFYRYSGQTLNAGKAYIVVDDEQVKSMGNMNIVVDNGDDTPTSIFGVAGQKTERDEWYTLQGVRLNGRPTGKGIYIHNGQRELIR